MADLFQDCEIKSYLYFGPDHDFLCPDLLYICVGLFIPMYYVQYVCQTEQMALWVILY